MQGDIDCQTPNGISELHTFVFYVYLCSDLDVTYFQNFPYMTGTQHYYHFFIHILMCSVGPEYAVKRCSQVGGRPRGV